MKIVYVSADRGIPVFGNKGASVHIRELVNALAAVGHEVTLLSASRGPGSSPLMAQVVTSSVHLRDGDEMRRGGGMTSSI